MKTRHLPDILRRFMLQSAFWLIVCFTIEAICVLVFHLHYPYSYPAVPPVQIFGDFRGFVDKFAVFHHRVFFIYGAPLMYPAPVLVFYKLFTLVPLSKHALVVTVRFVGIILATSWIMLYGFYRGLLRRGISAPSARLFVAAVYLLSLPFWFEVHQANMEFAVWMMTTLGVWAFWTHKPWAAATFFGIAAAMKIFPLVFLGLFLTRRQYRQAAFTLLVVVLTTVVSVWLVCPDFIYSWKQTNAAVALFRGLYMLQLRPMESGFDHSLFCLYKRLVPVLPQPAQMGTILNAYLAIAAISGILLYIFRIRKLPIVNQILTLSIAAILLPPTSYDYTLLHLYAPFALMVFVVIGQRASRRQIPGLGLAFVAFSFLLSPQSEFIYHGLRVAGQVKAVALFLLWLVALIYPFPGGEVEERTMVSPMAA